MEYCLLIAILLLRWDTSATMAWQLCTSTSTVVSITRSWQSTSCNPSGPDASHSSLYGCRMMWMCNFQDCTMDFYLNQEFGGEILVADVVPVNEVVENRVIHE